MAEAEVVLKYRELPVTLIHLVLLASVPVSTYFVLLTFLCVWEVSNRDNLGNISLFLCGLFTTFLSIILGVVITSDRTIFVSRNGISLPFLLCPRFGLRTEYGWTDLQTVRWLPRGKFGVLALKFKDGGRAKLKLDLLPAQQIEKLAVSMDIWAGGTDAFPALLELRSQMTEQTNKLPTPGYTQMWEEELNRRFGPTSFIPLEPGHRIRALTVERQLAFGGFSAIYQVIDDERRRFVLKEAVVPADGDESIRRSAEDMLDREACILASLSHPNIARVIDHFVENARHYILSELILGEDLRRLVKEHGPQSESNVLHWCVQLLDVLDYLHEQNPPVVHRDLSPDNLMLRETGELCVIDFGAANHFAGTATGTLIGKQAYIAPEQLRGKAEPRSDIYAFGCTLYFLLTGTDPEPLAVSHPKALKPQVSKDLDELVAKCTAQDSQDRPRSAAEVALRLQQCRTGEARHG